MSNRLKITTAVLILIICSAAAAYVMNAVVRFAGSVASEAAKSAVKKK